MREFSEFQIHDDEASKPAVEEKQIDPIPFGSHTQAFLPGNESEVAAQFEQELLQALDQCVFEIGFRILVLQVQELQHERISHVGIGG